jgi:hypothetical protein
MHKKGDKTIMTNYRPISLLISFSKVLETLTFNRLNQYLQANKILAPEQFGFRKGNHIEKTIFTLTDNTLTSLNQREQIGGTFCDLTKAFDCVNHEILLRKLYYYGIHGVSVNWFKTYLTNRKQRVNISPQNQKGEFSSRWETIENGVPQGSIQGPLFIIYVNDLPYGINPYAKPVMYADDTSLLITAKNLNDLQTKLNFTLNYMNEWFSVNGLSLKIEKTNIIKFCSYHLQNDLFQITYQNFERSHKH